LRFSLYAEKTDNGFRVCVLTERVEVCARLSVEVKRQGEASVSEEARLAQVVIKLLTDTLSVVARALEEVARESEDEFLAAYR
jgi:hypothetical protein